MVLSYKFLSQINWLAIQGFITGPKLHIFIIFRLISEESLEFLVALLFVDFIGIPHPKLIILNKIMIQKQSLYFIQGNP